jgi:hypothetical protein
MPVREVSKVSSAWIESSKTYDRKPSDFYPTPPDVTMALMNVLMNLDETPIRRVWEPACGDGSMSYVIESYGVEVVSTDIRNTGYGELSDFLWSEPMYQIMGTDSIITNPPFALALDFIRRAEWYKSVSVYAMLTKCNFWNVAENARYFDENPPQLVLPLMWRPAFLAEERGVSPLMDVQWNVWHRGMRMQMEQDYEHPLPLFKPLPRPRGPVPEPPFAVLKARLQTALSANADARRNLVP